MTPARKLSPEEIASKLPLIDGWTQQGDTLARDYRFRSYFAGINFVVAVADEAESMNHHPDLHVGWRKIGVVLSTHSAGGITELDIEMAQRMNVLFTQQETGA